MFGDQISARSMKSNYIQPHVHGHDIAPLIVPVVGSYGMRLLFACWRFVYEAGPARRRAGLLWEIGNETRFILK